MTIIDALSNTWHCISNNEVEVYQQTFFHIKFSEKITILIGINLRMHDSFSYKTKVLIAKLHIKIIPTELKWQIILIQRYAGR